MEMDFEILADETVTTSYVYRDRITGKYICYFVDNSIYILDDVEFNDKYVFSNYHSCGKYEILFNFSSPNSRTHIKLLNNGRNCISEGIEIRGEDILVPTDDVIVRFIEQLDIHVGKEPKDISSMWTM